ncbi:MAG: hypothetical protein R3C44_01410 [Chloroflexota bacterium]
MQVQAEQLAATDDPIAWVHLSTTTGDIPPSNGPTQQTAALVFDIDGDNINDFVIGDRKALQAGRSMVQADRYGLGAARPRTRYHAHRGRRRFLRY